MFNYVIIHPEDASHRFVRLVRHLEILRDRGDLWVVHRYPSNGIGESGNLTEVRNRKKVMRRKGREGRWRGKGKEERGSSYLAFFFLSVHSTVHQLKESHTKTYNES